LKKTDVSFCGGPALTKAFNAILANIDSPIAVELYCLCCINAAKPALSLTPFLMLDLLLDFKFWSD
jgi:hypothetical protein